MSPPLFKPYIGNCSLCGKQDVPIVVRAGHCKICRDSINKEKKKERKKNNDALRESLKDMTPGSKKRSDDSVFYKKMLNKWEKDGDLYCRECGDPIEEPSSSNVAHILAKHTAPSLRYDPENVICLCFECHFQYDHGDPTMMELYEFLQRKKDELKRKIYGIKGIRENDSERGYGGEEPDNTDNYT